jgi:glucose/arabinose dehydrogenase
MLHGRIVWVLGLSLLALAACSKPKSQQPQQQDQQATPSPEAPSTTTPDTAATEAPKPVGPAVSGPATAAVAKAPAAKCSGLPDKAAIAATLKKAMIDTYGGEEAPADFVVSSITGTDCKNLDVVYHQRGNGNTPQKTVAQLGDDGKWTLLFYKKQYPLP